MIKVDMAKAYDLLEWSFLMQVMKAFGFSTQWRLLIFNCISTTHFFILMNDTARSYFKSSRGLHQANHLSPDLFILTEEILSRMLNQAF